MFTSINPATGEAGESFRELDADGVELALSRAQTCFQSWRNSPIEQRAALLGRIADQWEANKQHLAETAVKEMGKTITGGIAEVEKCISGFQHYAEHGPGYLEPTEVTTATGRAVARWLPMGPVLAVMPWNFPYWQVVRFLAPTIMKSRSGACGCAAALASKSSTIDAGGKTSSHLPG